LLSSQVEETSWRVRACVCLDLGLLAGCPAVGLLLLGHDVQRLSSPGSSLLLPRGSVILGPKDGCVRTCMHSPSPSNVWAVSATGLSHLPPSPLLVPSIAQIAHHRVWGCVGGFCLAVLGLGWHGITLLWASPGFWPTRFSHSADRWRCLISTIFIFSRFQAPGSP
jgi:hypothetical protein